MSTCPGDIVEFTKRFGLPKKYPKMTDPYENSEGFVKKHINPYTDPYAIPIPRLYWNVTPKEVVDDLVRHYNQPLGGPAPTIYGVDKNGNFLMDYNLGWSSGLKFFECEEAAFIPTWKGLGLAVVKKPFNSEGF